MLFTGKSFSTHEVVQLMHAGAHSVVQKPIDVERLTHFLEDIASKSLAMQAQEQEFLQLSDQFSTLTGREKDVLDCVLLGTSNKETAQQLKVSVRTVESRRAKVYRKLSAANVAELVRRVDRLMQLRQHFEEQQNKSRTDVRIDDCALRHDSRPRQSPHWSESLRRIGI
jgi:FixJ family two-component response regulator